MQKKKLWIHYYSCDTNFRGLNGFKRTTNLNVQHSKKKKKPQNQTSPEIQFFLNLQKLVPMKMEKDIFQNVSRVHVDLFT